MTVNNLPTIVMTGASGFVGRHLQVFLRASGAHVIPVSRQPCSGMLQVDDYALCPDGDVLIHLGEQSDRAQVNYAGDAYLESSARVVDALATRRYRRFIYISSGTVYGDACLKPGKPGDAVVAHDIYSRSKLINEDIVLSSGGAVARLSNLYGIGMSKNNVLSDIISQLTRPGSLIVRDCTPVRDFLNISDVCVALALFAESKYSGIINIASGHGTSVHRLVEIALAAAGQAERKVVSTDLVASFSSNILDIDATRTILNWKPEVDLVSGLTELVSSKMGSNHG